MDKDSEEYRHWRADHNNCKSNYKGSAPAMEVEGTDRIIRRSVITSFDMQNFTQMVTAKVSMKSKMSIQWTMSRLSSKNA